VSTGAYRETLTRVFDLKSVVTIEVLDVISHCSQNLLINPTPAHFDHQH
jgi:hypothetical protein